MEEIWKSIEGFENYEVSNLGKVRNKKGKELKQQLNIYYHVGLYDSNKKCYKKAVHRLVAFAFIPNPDNLPIVNHIDENKLNNIVSNLEWTSIKDNVLHSTKSHPNDLRYKKASKRILQYNLAGEFIKEWNSVTEASIQLGITVSTISSCLKNKTKTSGGFQWKYFEQNYPLNINSVNGKTHINNSIIQYDLNGNYIRLWNSIKDIVKEYNIRTPYKITDCCKGITENYNGYIWKYYSKDFKSKIIPKHLKIGQYNSEKQLIKLHNNIIDALNYIGGKSEAMIIHCCEGLRNKAYGYIWKYEE